jgi:hypothetical protein
VASTVSDRPGWCDRSVGKRHQPLPYSGLGGIAVRARVRPGKGHDFRHPLIDPGLAVEEPGIDGERRGTQDLSGTAAPR